MNRFHIQGMSQYEVNPVVLAEIADPVPAMHTFDTHDDVANVRLQYLQQFFLVSRNAPVCQDFAFLVQNTEVEQPRMQINSTIVRCISIKSHWVFSLRFGHLQFRPLGLDWGRRLNSYQNHAPDKFSFHHFVQVFAQFSHWNVSTFFPWCGRYGHWADFWNGQVFGAAFR